MSTILPFQESQTLPNLQCAMAPPSVILQAIGGGGAEARQHNVKPSLGMLFQQNQSTCCLQCPFSACKFLASKSRPCVQTMTYQNSNHKQQRLNAFGYARWQPITGLLTLFWATLLHSRKKKLATPNASLYKTSCHQGLDSYLSLGLSLQLALMIVTMHQCLSKAKREDHSNNHRLLNGTTKTKYNLVLIWKNQPSVMHSALFQP